MKFRWSTLLMIAVGLQAASARATTWMDTEVDDPIANGKCSVQEPASYGSYIYEWPEKYDQVFWPFTDPNGIWFCGKSGFVAFIGDMELKPEEKTRIVGYLKSHPAPRAPTVAQKLDRLEAVYALRDLDPAARLRFARAIAYQFESLGDQQRADRMRRVVRDEIGKNLEDAALAADLRLQYLFVAANYAREFGDTAESDRLLAELETALRAAPAEENGYAQYLKDSLDGARKIAPGGKLAP